MDERFLIPIFDLPGPLPEGAPIAYDQSAGWWRGVLVGRTSQGVALGIDTTRTHPWTLDGLATPTDLYLDLSPPSMNTAGYPLRIDGLSVAAEMLARAMGIAAASGVYWCFSWNHWSLVTPGGGLAFAGSQPAAWGRRCLVPALANIDPADSHADRLAMVACVKARVWEPQ